MMGILTECWSAVTTLHTINLWNVGLTDINLSALASTIPSCTNLRTLILDANPVPGQRWDLLIQVLCACYILIARSSRDSYVLVKPLFLVGYA
jgi:hypothetical protein